MCVHACLWCALVTLIGPARAQVLQYGDRAPDEMQTVGDPGLLTLFDAGAEGRWLNAIEVYASSGGGDGFELYVVDLDGQLLRRVTLPSVVLANPQDGWCRLPIPPMVVPREFGIGLIGQSGDTVYLGLARQEVGFALRDLGWPRGGGALSVGVYRNAESHSYRWSPGTPGEGLWDRDWMVRAYVSDTADGDPDATDLVVLSSGEAFFDRVLSAEGDPLEVRTASHGALPREEIASLHLQAISYPSATTVVVELANGRRVEGALESMTEEGITVRQGERLTTLALGDVERIEFPTIAAVPIGPQVAPQVSETRRAWSPEQVTGPPDTPEGGDRSTAWASRTPDDQDEWLLLAYETAVDIAEVRVWETYNPGAIGKVTAVLADDTEVTLWEGEDPTVRTPGEFVVQTQEAVTAQRIKLYVDSPDHPGWNEIDAVELVGKDGTRQWAVAVGASSSYADR
jgi:hypothetical protein